MTNVVPFPTRDRGRIVGRKEPDGRWFIEHEGPGAASYGPWCRVDTLEEAMEAADVASAAYGGLDVVFYDE